MEPNDPTLERSSPFSGSDEYCVLVLYISSTIEGKEVDVEVDELQDCIKKYAKAKKIQIQKKKKGEALKAYVEFASATETTLIKDVLDHKTIDELGITLRAFFSRIDEISIPSNNPFAKDFTKIRQSKDDDNLMKLKQAPPMLGDFRWKSEDPQLLGNLMDELRNEGDDMNDDLKRFGGGGDPNLLDGPKEYVFQHLPHVQKNLNSKSKDRDDDDTNTVVEKKKRRRKEPKEYPHFGYPQGYPEGHSTVSKRRKRKKKKKKKRRHYEESSETESSSDEGSYSTSRSHYPPPPYGYPPYDPAYSHNPYSHNPYYPAPPSHTSSRKKRSHYPRHPPAPYYPPGYPPYYGYPPGGPRGGHPGPHHQSQRHCKEFYNNPVKGDNRSEYSYDDRSEKMSAHSHNSLYTYPNKHNLPNYGPMSVGGYSDYGHSEYGHDPRMSQYSGHYGREHNYGRDHKKKKKSHHSTSKKSQMYNFKTKNSTTKRSKNSSVYAYEDAKSTSSGGKSLTKFNLEKFRQIIDSRSSSVLYVRGLESDDLTDEGVYKLFGNFGNVIKLLYFKKKGSALIEYESPELATIAKEMLSNLCFFGSLLKISFSNYATIEKRMDDKSNEIYKPNPRSFRFRENKKISINPPSKTLHLSNIAREIYNKKDIANIFIENAKVEKVKLLNSQQDQKCMALVELDSLENALIVMATVHNTPFFSRSLKISFTRSKI